MILNTLYLILFGYLIGSISPGYFFGKIVKGIDIRKYGNRQIGATNAYRTVGPAYGIITAALDILKAVFAYYISVSGLNFLPLNGLPPNLAILPGLAAVLGHNFPFYLKFKGGRGAASLFGLNLIVLIYTNSIYALFLLAGSLVYSAIISEEREKVWTATAGRLAAKISALALPLGFIWFSKEIIWIVTVLMSVFLIFDVARFSSRKINHWYIGSKKFAKEKEFRRLSGYSLFLISAFLLFKFFPAEIAALSLVLFIIGDVLAPAGQLRYMPKQKIFGDLSRHASKTLGGAIVIFVFSLLAGLFLKSLTPLVLPFNFIIAGGLAAAVLDQFAASSPKFLYFLIDDNILVPLGTALTLTFLL